MALNSEIYVDKTGLLSYTNKVMDTKNAWICNSRPRRFGKSITADMLTAYYSKGCESARMFEGRKISGEKNWREHLNRYDVIHIDVQRCRTSAKSAEATVSYIESNILKELRIYYPGEMKPDIGSLPEALSEIHTVTGKKFIIIIDEWDVLIRDEVKKRMYRNNTLIFCGDYSKEPSPPNFFILPI